MKGCRGSTLPSLNPIAGLRLLCFVLDLRLLFVDEYFLDEGDDAMLQCLKLYR